MRHVAPTAKRTMHIGRSNAIRGIVSAVLAVVAALSVAAGASAADPSPTARTGSGTAGQDADLPGLSLSDLLGIRADLHASGTGTSDAATAMAVQSVDAADAEAVRAKLLAWTNDFERAVPNLDEFVDPGSEGYYDTLRERVTALTPYEITMLDAQLSEDPVFWEIPAFIESVRDPSQPTPPLFARAIAEWPADVLPGSDEAAALFSLQQAAVPTPNATATVPFPTMPEFPPRGDLPSAPDDRAGCPGSFGGGDCAGCPASVPSAAIFALRQAITLMGGTRATLAGIGSASGNATLQKLSRENKQLLPVDPADPDTDLCVTLVVACVCLTLPNPVFYVLHSIRLGLQYTVRALNFQNALASNCQEGLHRALQNLFLDATISSRVTQSSLDRHAEMRMVLAIEENLLEQRDDRVSLFQLPGSMCGDEVPDDTPLMTGFEGFRFCGKLEFTRKVVADRIRQSATIEGRTDVNGALAELAAGDQHYMDGRWRAAYERYSQAYRAAARPDVQR